MRGFILVLAMSLLPVLHVNTCKAEEYLGINYRIVNRDEHSKSKLSLDVVIGQKVEEAYLTFFAMRIRNREPKKYDRMFISYYLPGMDVRSGAWAISHFNPELECKILGAPIKPDDSKESRDNAANPLNYGVWIDNRIGAKYSIYRDGNKDMLSIGYKDGSESSEEVFRKPDNRGHHFITKQNSEGTYYLIYPNNNLGIYDNQGLIVKLSPR